MSLLRQLLISVTVAMCIILAGTLWFSLSGAHGYLNERLQAEAQNTASSLALSLSQPGNQDTVTQELLLKALFDTGQYHSILLSTPSGEVLHKLERAPDAGASKAPRWLDAWFPLRAPTVTQAVSDGWKQIGEVAVTPDSGFARAALWKMAWQVLALVVAAGVLWALFAMVLIRWLRRALQTEVAEQVAAIADGRPSGNPDSPPVGQRIKELAQVHTVIESVRERVRATADEQSRQIETLEVALHSDEVTGAANRRFFINELRRALRPHDDDEAAQAMRYGHVLVFRQRDLASINARHDRQATDAWLRRVSDSVREVIMQQADPNRPVPQLARLNGSDFVVLLAAYDGPDTTDLLEALRQKLDSLRIQTADSRLCRWCYALTDYGPSCDVGQVLARLDHGLMRAENAGHDEVEYMASSEYRSLGATGNAGESAWKALIEDALREGRVALNVESSIYGNDDTPDRHEALLSLQDAEDDTSISGYLFMPPAVRLGLSGACDLRAMELGTQWVRTHPGTLSLRVSLASLLLPDFLAGMERVLSAEGISPEVRARLVLEVDAHGFVAYPDELDAFCSLAARLGVGVGVRRLAEQPAALLRLHRVRIRYIKLGGDLISGLLESPGAVQLIAAITESAIGQGVKIYAHDVPNAATATLLREYGVLLPVSESFSDDDDDQEGDFVDN